LIVERKSNIFFATAGVLFILLGMVWIHSFLRQSADESSFSEKRNLVRELGLTDLCLFTDARYTRHPSMADLSTPFQDYPASLEHFPSGALMIPPPHLKRHGLD
jgi:hypothetical protein